MSFLFYAGSTVVLPSVSPKQTCPGKPVMGYRYDIGAVLVALPLIALFTRTLDEYLTLPRLLPSAHSLDSRLSRH